VINLGFFNWIKGFFDTDGIWKLKDELFLLNLEYHYKKLAVETCVNMIANTLSQCEFKTFENGKEKRGENYYLFNVEPNQNQNASEFMHSLVSRLIHNNEVLVIMQNDMFYVADSFDTTEYALKDNVYKNVTVKNLTFEKSFLESDVLHIKLNDSNIKKVIDSLYESYGKLISSAKNIYKRSNAKRVVLEGDFLRPQTDEEQKAINDMFDNQFKNWFEADNAGAVFQLQKGYTLTDLSGNGKSGVPAQNSRDIRALIDDIFDFTAMGFLMPRSLIKGDLADVEKVTDNYLMFRVNPLAELISDEFNRKVYKKENFLKRNYMKIDTSMIKILSIVDLATAADKFFAIGVNNINDNFRMLGRETLSEDWAEQRFVTKNYQTIESVEKTEKGGEGN
jgi:HK97 family phage portal protein